MTKRKALIIAVSEYEKLDNLNFCKNDGESIHDILLSQNYEIAEGFKLIDRVDGRTIREKIIDFFTDPSVTLEDTLVFYYSGHGVPDSEGGMYLSASEVDADYPYRRGFSFYELTKMMSRSLSKKIVTILGCCYSGAAEISKGSENDAAKLGNAAVLNGSNVLVEGEGRCVLASSQANQEAYALKEENHSIFTHYLIKGLKGEAGAVDNYGYVTADSLGKFIYDGIMSLPIDRRPKQKPVGKMDMSGEIIISHYPEHSKEVIRLTSPDDDIGKQYLDKKDYKKALEYYERVTKESREAELWINKGIAHHKLGNYSEANRCFDIVVNYNPTDALALCYKGTALLNLGKYKDSLQYLQKSLDLDAMNEHTWFGKGMSLFYLGRLDEALAAINKSLQVNPKGELAMSGKAQILKEQGKINEALHWYDESIKTKPILPVAWAFKALLLTEIRRLEEAVQCYDKAIEYYENYPLVLSLDTLWNSKGNILAGLGRQTEALQSFDNAIRSSTKNWAYWINKGHSLKAMKRFGEAIKCAEEVLRLGRKDSNAVKYAAELMNAIGMYLCILDRFREAIGCFDMVLRIDSKNDAFKFKKLTQENPREMKKVCLKSFPEL